MAASSCRAARAQMADDNPVRIQQADPGNFPVGHASLAATFAQEILRGENRLCSELLSQKQRAFTLWHAATQHIEVGI